MKIQPIRTEADYDRALQAIDGLWGAKRGSPRGDEFEVLLVLVEDYESKHHPVDPLESLIKKSA